jgi:hypothetical protein
MTNGRRGRACAPQVWRAQAPTCVWCCLLPPAAARAAARQVHDGTYTPADQFLKDPDSLCSTVTWKDEEDRVVWVYRIQVRAAASACVGPCLAPQRARVARGSARWRAAHAHERAGARQSTHVRAHRRTRPATETAWTS